MKYFDIMESDEDWERLACEQLEKLTVQDYSSDLKHSHRASKRLSFTPIHVQNITKMLSFEGFSIEKNHTVSSKNSMVLEFIREPIQQICRRLVFASEERAWSVHCIQDGNPPVEFINKWYAKLQLQNPNVEFTRPDIEANAKKGYTWRCTALYDPNAQDLSCPFTFKAMDYGRSSRALRKYGSHRFIKVQLPKSFNKSLSSTFAHTRFTLLERRYRVLHIKSEGTLYLFAEASCDVKDTLRMIQIDEVREWHIPSNENMEMSLVKYNARFDLAFSETIDTFILPPSSPLCIQSEDITSSTEQVMTNGCGSISKTAMEVVSKYASIEKSASEKGAPGKNNSLGLLPSAVQGRFGPYKVHSPY